MGLRRAACSMTPQSQGTSTPQPQAMEVTTDAKQAQVQAQFKARQTEDYYNHYYHCYCATLKQIILIQNMIKHNSIYSRGQNENSTQPGWDNDRPNKEKLTTTAQPQGGANLYKVTEEKARYARAFSADSEHNALKLLKVLMDKLDNLDKIKSYFSRGDKESSTPPGKRRRRQEPG